MAGEQRMGQRRVLGKIGRCAKALGRTSVFPKSKKKPLICFEMRDDMLRFLLLDDCFDYSIENALGKGTLGKERSFGRPLQ